MFDEKSIEEVKEMVDKRINELEGEVSETKALLNEKDRQLSKQNELVKEQDLQLSEQSEMIKEQNSLLKKQEKTLSDAISYVAKISGISEKEAFELIHSQKNTK